MKTVRFSGRWFPAVKAGPGWQPGLQLLFYVTMLELLSNGTIRAKTIKKHYASHYQQHERFQQFDHDVQAAERERSKVSAI